MMTFKGFCRLGIFDSSSYRHWDIGEENTAGSWNVMYYCNAMLFSNDSVIDQCSVVICHGVYNAIVES